MKSHSCKRVIYWPSSFFLKTYILSIIVFNLSCIGYPVQAKELGIIVSIIDEANSKNLSQSNTWHKLLHYKKSGSSVKSEITSDDFFLSKNGRFDSNAELISTIDQMLASTGELNLHAQCRFPARFKWLKENLAFPEELDITEQACPEYTAWILNGNIESISLIFASGHLSNPASFYGHILLKFNTTDQEQSDLLDTSINFGAMTPENENGLVYIIKGLAGGYDSAFTNQLFYRHNHIYAESELRDLWNYELNLSQKQVQSIVDHSWELLGKNFTYYFLKQNCGYRMAELLNLVIEEPLLPEFKQWAMPSDILSGLTKINHNGMALVKDISIIKSRQNSFRDRFTLLTREEKNLVIEYIALENITSLNDINTLNNNSTKRVIETLFDYYAFILTKKNSDTKNIELRRRKIIIDRLKLDTNDTQWPTENAKRSPDESQYSSMLQLSLLNNNQIGDGAEIRFRAAYFDFLSVSSGNAPFTQMSMFDLKLKHQKNKIRLSQFELLNIETLNISPTGLKEDRDYAWKIRTGIKDYDLSCSSCLYGYLEGGIGKGFSIGNKSALYAMITGEISFFGPQSTQLKSGATVGILTEYSDWWKTQIEAGFLESITSSHKTKKFVSWENRFINNKSWDIRLKITYNNATEVRMSTGYYW